MTYYNQNRMRVNVNHPSFISFLENISNNILSAIKIDEYFDLSADQKLSVSFTVLNLLKNSARVRSSLSDEDLKAFIQVLCKKNESIENYEFAAVLNDVFTNYEKLISISSSPVKKPTKSKKAANPDSTPPQQ